MNDFNKFGKKVKVGGSIFLMIAVMMVVLLKFQKKIII